jgi:ribonuclease VapC
MAVESHVGSDGARQAEAFLRRAGVVEPVIIEHGLARQPFSTSANATRPA